MASLVRPTATILFGLMTGAVLAVPSTAAPSAPAPGAAAPSAAARPAAVASTAAPRASAPRAVANESDPLEIPPPPEVPGYPPEPEVKPLTPEEEAARVAAAAASPRVSKFAPARRGPPKPEVPPAPVHYQQEIKLIASEQLVADRNAMSESLRVMKADLRQPSNFDTVYEIDERPDVLVRANGALYAVFPQGDYALAKQKKKLVIQTLVPAGTTFYIGEPDWRSIRIPGIRGMTPRLETFTAEEYEERLPPAGRADRIEPTMPHDYAGVYLEAVVLGELPGYAPISAHIDTFIGPVANAFRPPPDIEPVSSSQSLEHPVLGRSRVGGPDPEGVVPPLHHDAAYRRQRVSELLERAAKQGS